MKGMINMFKKYKTYESLEGKVSKALNKSLGMMKGLNLASAMIAVEVWDNAKQEQRVPTDRDISRGIYEFFGSVR
jgi:hypothetical protein